MGTDAAGQPQVIEITGGAAVGTSAFAVHACHELQSAYGDVQLYGDLRSSTSHALLVSFLRLMGAPGYRKDSEFDDLARAYWSILSDKRAIVLLDNADPADDLRVFAPAGRHHLLVLTGRQPVWNGPALSLELSGLSDVEGVELLSATLGNSDRWSADGAREIVRACDGLPLAIVLAGSRLRQDPWLQMADLAERLRDPHDVLDEFDTGPRSLRHALRLSFDALAPEVQRLFVQMSLFSGSFDPDAVAPLVDVPPKEARRLVERLLRERLVDSGPAGAIRMHHLTRAFAQEQRETVQAEVPEAAWERLAAWYEGVGSKHRAAIEQSPSRWAERPHGDAGDELERPIRTAIEWFSRASANIEEVVVKFYERAGGDSITAIDPSEDSDAGVFGRLDDLLRFFDHLHLLERLEQCYRADRLLANSGSLPDRYRSKQDIADIFVRLGWYADARKIVEGLDAAQSIDQPTYHALNLVAKAVVLELEGKDREARAARREARTVIKDLEDEAVRLALSAWLDASERKFDSPFDVQPLDWFGLPPWLTAQRDDAGVLITRTPMVTGETVEVYAIASLEVADQIAYETKVIPTRLVEEQIEYWQQQPSVTLADGAADPEEYGAQIAYVGRIITDGGDGDAGLAVVSPAVRLGLPGAVMAAAAVYASQQRAVEFFRELRFAAETGWPYAMRLQAKFAWSDGDCAAGEVWYTRYARSTGRDPIRVVRWMNRSRRS